MIRQRCCWLAASIAFLALVCPRPELCGAPPPGELNLRIQLIWGTNGERPPDKPRLKEVDEKLKKRLAAVFKWKNYFEVNRLDNVLVPEKQSKRLRIDKPCEVEIHNLGNANIEVNLIGEGKPVVKYLDKKCVKAKEPLVLGGPDKNDAAWFIVLTSK